VQGFKVGDAVSTIPSFSLNDYGLYGDLANAPVHAVTHHPASLSWAEAAAIWMQYLTAYGALIDIAKLTKGDTILIPAASSSVGLAAIQIANRVGAVPVALTRSTSKRQALRDAGAAHVIVTDEQNLVKEVDRLENGLVGKGEGIELLAKTPTKENHLALPIQADFLVNDMAASDPHTAAQIVPLVYDDLIRLAAHRLAKETPGQMLQPTDLVHEAYLRLLQRDVSAHWDDRAHFFGAAAEAMRRILVENARRKKSLKRGGHLVRQDLDAAELLAPTPREDLLALDDALTELAATDRPAADLVQLRYFGGLTIAEAAGILRISSRTADRLWSYARAWIRCEMEEPDKGTVPPRLEGRPPFPGRTTAKRPS
jgi:RNA polymerase sigma factor (TIGR02999 family)